MSIRRTPIAAVLIIAGLSSAPAAELAKIDRAVGKEPAYASKSPKYCLLIFGPEARTRVWLVLDKDTAYVDRNGNGNLTEENERVKLPAFRPSPYEQYVEQRNVRLGDVEDGKIKHTGLALTQFRIDPDFIPKTAEDRALTAIPEQGELQAAFVFDLRVDVQVRPRPGDGLLIAGRITHYAGTDAGGHLRFADNPRAAPIVHFGGPLQMGLLCNQELQRGDKPAHLKTVVGTPGLGPGTFASVAYGGLIANDVQPVAEIEFPSKPGQTPLKTRLALPYRC